jgi:sterol desaturase/sphingolipid hydroxylase (fatty acid hydroxylase superfamily)
MLNGGSDPIWVLSLKNLVTQTFGYFALVSMVFLLVWRWGKVRFKGARIPQVDRVNGAQLLREVKHTFVTLCVGMTSVGVVVALHTRGLTRLVMADTPAWQVLAWTAACVVFNDAWFYCWHRLLHHPRLFRYVHAVHHKSVDVNPFTSYSFHPFEGLILGVWIVPAVVLLPLPAASLAMLQVIGLANNMMAHLGYEFAPRGALRIPLLRLTNTATFHSLHHTRLHGNYGLHSRFWDRLFGTELPEYEKVFLQRGEAPVREADNGEKENHGEVATTPR